ncbi:MAG: hypothetical protein EXR45_04255 [Chloroflexi bacterium]|nr:hypothetical protein [Chloroflexota bacterium]
MSGLVRIQVDTPALVDAILAYVNDPRADRNAFHTDLLSDELEHQLGLTQDILEALLLDGASNREDVEPLVGYLVAYGVAGVAGTPGTALDGVPSMSSTDVSAPRL